MTILQNLAVLALRQLIGDGANIVVNVVDRFLSDPNQRITCALHRSNTRAWKSLEIALAGDSLWERGKMLLTPGEEQVFRPLVQTFLKAASLSAIPDNDRQARQQCLRELRAARENGLITGGHLDSARLKEKVSAIAAAATPQASLDEEWKIVESIVVSLEQGGYKTLAWLLRQRPADGRPLLVVAVRYFFRREVESAAEFARGLFFEQLDTLGLAQRDGLESLERLLLQYGSRFDGLLSLAVDLRDTVLDLQAEVKRYGQQIGDLQKMGSEVLTRLQRHQDLQCRPLNPRDSLSYSDESERKLVRDIKAWYRRLPDEQRRLPALLHALGKLEVVIGDFDGTQEDFQAVAKMVPQNLRDKTEVCYHTFRTALEQADWPTAFASIQEAAALDPQRFAQFPADRFEPVQILGAGGFGVVFLCRHCRTNKHLVVKSLLADGLDRDVQEVFAEAGVLEDLEHPAIIRLRDCDYADPIGAGRPYLVMDYFPGQTLHGYVEEHGPLQPDELVPIARAVAEAMREVHGKNIYHRDIKPANVLVCRTDTGWQVKIIDFGLALRSKEGEVNNLIGQGKSMLGKSIAGTPHYAAPEQRQMELDPVGPYSDVYAFGKMCFYALLKTHEPGFREVEDLPERWRNLLIGCTATKVKNRLPDFVEVLKRLPMSEEEERPQRLPRDEEPILEEEESSEEEHGFGQRSPLQEKSTSQYLLFFDPPLIEGRLRWMHFSWTQHGEAYCLRDFHGQEIRHHTLRRPAKDIWKQAKQHVHCTGVLKKNVESRQFWRAELRKRSGLPAETTSW